MRVTSPLEDFLGRTVRSVAGALERLRFLGDIRTQDKKYDHWGMVSTYGEEKANRAMSEAHTRAWIEVLRAPLPELENDVLRSEKAQELGPEEYIRRLERNEEKIVPAEIEGGSRRHFSMLLQTLRMLVKRKKQ